MRLIDADALLKKLDDVMADLEATTQPSTMRNYNDAGQIFDSMIRMAPTIRDAANGNADLSDLIEQIRQRVSTSARCMQLSEEASELAQAACKYARILDGTNPTPVTKEEAWEAVCEEYDDVQNAAAVLGVTGSRLRQFEKRARWRDRCLESQKKQ